VYSKVRNNHDLSEYGRIREDVGILDWYICLKLIGKHHAMIYWWNFSILGKRKEETIYVRIGEKGCHC
jgi:hypothetical protein